LHLAEFLASIKRRQNHKIRAALKSKNRGAGNQKNQRIKAGQSLPFSSCLCSVTLAEDASGGQSFPGGKRGETGDFG
jgi:hypothetical protein